MSILTKNMLVVAKTQTNKQTKTSKQKRKEKCFKMLQVQKTSWRKKSPTSENKLLFFILSWRHFEWTLFSVWCVNSMWGAFFVRKDKKKYFKAKGWLSERKRPHPLFFIYSSTSHLEMMMMIILMMIKCVHPELRASGLTLHDVHWKQTEKYLKRSIKEQQ